MLDKSLLGEDLFFEKLSDLGDLEIYDMTSKEELPDRIRDAEILVLNKIRIDEKAFSYMEKIKLICVFATGYDNIDLAIARKRGVAVCNVPAYSTDSVMLFTVSTVLNLISHLSEYAEFVTTGRYTAAGKANSLYPTFHEIGGLTWGIVGYGNIGKRVATVAKALGARVIVNKVTPTDSVECVDIDTLCKESDIITLHCPLNDSTRSLISRERLSLMKKTAILVNEARGAVVDEKAVADAVINGDIAAFGCDVYSVEPFGEDHPYSALLGMKNVCLTPHAAWAAFEARERCLNVIYENIKAFKSDKIKNRVDI